MIQIKNLTKVFETINYNVVALSNLNFEFKKGEVVVILGRSGSGKSTFLNVLGGFDNTYSGSYFFDTYEFKALEAHDIDALRSKKIGFIFQHQVLFNHLTVLENVELALNVLGITNDKKKRLNAMKALTLVGLRSHAYKKPWQLSGGEKQRVSIARAIVKDPEVIICDEPTAALDSVTSKEVLDLLASVCKNKLLIIATHNKSIVKNYGTRIIELKSGYVVRDELVKDDKSNIKVDELDELVDEGLYDEQVSLTQKSVVLSEKVEQSKILKDLELDLGLYKERTEESFIIDEAEKERVIQRRKDQVNTEERFDTFTNNIHTMANMKYFSQKSVKSHYKTYLFLCFFLVSFILFSIVGLNLTASVFMKNNNTDEINYQLYKENEIIQLSDMNQIAPFLGSERLTEELLKQDFIADVNHDQLSEKNYQVIVNDASFHFDYIKNSYEQLENYLNEHGYNKSYHMVYDSKNIMIGRTHDGLLFDNLNKEYTSYKIEQQLMVETIIDSEIPINLSVLSSDHIKDELRPYLVGNSRFPSKSDEVILSVETLVQAGVFSSVNSTNVNEVYRKFKGLEEDKKVIQVLIPKVTLSYDESDELQVEETYVAKEFKIVGIYNAGTIESFYKQPGLTTMIFSKEATEALTIQIENNLEDVDIFTIPLYMEVDQIVYQKEELDVILDDIQYSYLQSEYKIIDDQLSDYRMPLEAAFIRLADYLEGNSTLSLSSPIGPNFPSLNHEKLLFHYLTAYFELWSSEEQIKNCISCDFTDYDDLYERATTLFTKVTPEEQQKIIAGLRNSSSLANERTISRLIFDTYWHRFNITFDQMNKVPQPSEEVPTQTNPEIIYIDNDYAWGGYLDLYHKVEESTSTSGLVDYNFLTNQLPIKSIVLLSGRYVLNPSLILTGMSSYTSIIMVIVLISILSATIQKLFKNIYQLFVVNRRAEFGSLRILGAKHDDLVHIMKLEGRLLVTISYLMVIGILLLGKASSILTKDQSFVYYLYHPLLDFYVNVRLADLFNISLISLISVFVLMQVFYKKQLIDANIDRNLNEMKTLISLSDWGGE